jgi:hypothetical protein
MGKSLLSRLRGLFGKKQEQISYEPVIVFTTTYVYKGTTVVGEEAESFAQGFILPHSEQDKQPCCVESLLVGTYAITSTPDHDYGYGGNIKECPTCGAIELDEEYHG